MIPRYLIRAARESDLPGLRKLNLQSLEQNYPKSFWTAKFALGTPHLVVTTAANPRKPVGYVATMPWPAGSPHPSPEIMVYSLAVEARHRRRGLARRLLEALTQAISPGTPLVLHTQVTNEAARALYRGAGFVEGPIIPDYYKPGDAVELRRTGSKVSLTQSE